MLIKTKQGVELSESQVLRKAAKVLKERGWYQGDFSDGSENGCVCAYGAMNVVLIGSPTPYNGNYDVPDDETEVLLSHAISLAEDMIGVLEDKGIIDRSLYLGLEEFNDLDGMNAETVINAFETVAEYLEQQER